MIRWHIVAPNSPEGHAPLFVQRSYNASPVIFSIPHGGTYVPPRYTKDLVVRAEDLWSDWYTLDLYDFLQSFDAGVVAARSSRFVADANRDPTKPGFAPFWEGIVASTTPMGEGIYRVPPTDRQLQTRIQTHHLAYHEALSALVAEALGHSQRVLVLDLHSFGFPTYADVVVGDSHGTTATRRTVSMVERILQRNSFRTVRNSPFSGGWIVRRFRGNPAVEAIQLELNQRRYANSDDVDAAIPRPRKSRAFAETKNQLEAALSAIVDEYATG